MKGLWQLIYQNGRLSLIPDDEFENRERRLPLIVLMSVLADDVERARVAIVERAPVFAPIVRFM